MLSQIVGFAKVVTILLQIEFSGFGTCKMGLSPGVPTMDLLSRSLAILDYSVPYYSIRRLHCFALPLHILE